MPGPRKRKRRGRNSEHTLGAVAREVATLLGQDSPVLATFKNAAMQMSARQDRHERLAKLSREITVESKRIINLLHTPTRTDESVDTITEAKVRFLDLINEPIKGIGLELENIPAHLHSSAVANGFQAFVTARTLMSLMTEKRVITYPEVQKEFEYSITEDDQQRTVVTMLPHADYMLGLADLTGELLRKIINSMAIGDIEDCNHAWDVARHLYTGYLGLTIKDRHIQRMVHLPRTNVKKIEFAMYALHIRGEEASSMMLLPSASVRVPPPMMLLPDDLEREPPRDAGDADDDGFYQDSF